MVSVLAVDVEEVGVTVCVINNSIKMENAKWWRGGESCPYSKLSKSTPSSVIRKASFLKHLSRSSIILQGTWFSRTDRSSKVGQWFWTHPIWRHTYVSICRRPQGSFGGHNSQYEARFNRCVSYLAVGLSRSYKPYVGASIKPLSFPALQPIEP